MKSSLRVRGRLGSLLALLFFAAMINPHVLFGQFTAIKVLDASVLKPPAGARVAIVEFDDLECPTCAHFNPLLKRAVANYKIPWVRHDFLIPYHNWSRDAAVRARWFDMKSKALGDEYRDEVFANQPSIYNVVALNQFTQKFAQSHGISLPFAFDPQGKLEAAVQADTDLGRRMGIDATPTIFIVSENAKGAHYTQVLDPDRDLYRTIDQALAGTRHE
ncbi:MAG TPA: thioredoxin domain-containing protein [Terracidiphilus sp.]|nr:thioredoxin domain-containing protein [Terracidiphilus sp.]